MKIVKIILFIILPLNLSGQLNNSMYFMPELYQARFLNPAYQHPCRVNIGLPVLSSIYLNYANTNISGHVIYNTKTDSGNVLVPSKLVKKLSKKNYVSLETHISLFSLGIKRNDNYFSFDITEKVDVYVGFPKDILDFVITGNDPEVNGKTTTKGLGVDFNHYREYALGYSRPLNNQLTVGVKGKLLFGKLNLYTKKLDLDITTDPVDYSWLLELKSNIKSSIPGLTVPKDTATGLIGQPDINMDELLTLNTLLNRKNPGIAFDFGATYNYSEKIDFYASLIDLGFLRWRTNPIGLEQDGEIDFTGIGNILRIGDYDYNEFLDSLYNEFLVDVLNKNYFSWLPPKIYAGATYKLTPGISLGALGRGMIYNRKIFPSLSLSANIQVFRSFKTAFTYSIINRSYNNAGLAFYVGRRGLQFYLVGDNLIGSIRPLYLFYKGNFAPEDVALVIQNVDLRFGFNIIFGCRQKEKGSSGSYYFNEKGNTESSTPSIYSHQKSKLTIPNLRKKGCTWMKRMEPDYIKKKKYMKKNWWRLRK